MTNKPCPNPQCFNGLVAPEGAEDAEDCPTCGGDGFVEVEESEEE